MAAAQALFATVSFAKRPAATNTVPHKKTLGGRVMTSRLALWATVAAIVTGTTAGASAQTYEVTKLVPGSAFHGVHGLGIDKSGRLFAGSVAGAALYESTTARRRLRSPRLKAWPMTSRSHLTAPWRGPGF
jgi:hypothetical protein